MLVHAPDADSPGGTRDRLSRAGNCRWLASAMIWPALPLAVHHPTCCASPTSDLADLSEAFVCETRRAVGLAYIHVYGVRTRMGASRRSRCSEPLPGKPARTY